MNLWDALVRFVTPADRIERILSADEHAERERRVQEAAEAARAARLRALQIEAQIRAQRVTRDA